MSTEKVSAGANGADDPMQAPYRTLGSRPQAVDVARRADGTLLLTCPYPVGPVERDVIAWLRRWSAEAPDRPMLAERDADRRWRRVDYGRMRAMADSIGQGLLELGLVPGDVLMVLSGNSIEHAAMVLGAMTVGVIAAPIAPAYSLAPGALSRLEHVVDVVRPRAVYAADRMRFARALDRVARSGARVIVPGAPEGGDAIAFERLAATPPGAALEAAYARVGPDTVAKILFTSGSTGMPKGVINTQRMMCTNQAMTAALRVAPDGAPAMLSWLPWNHTMGGNGLFNRNLRVGGTLYIDDGRPLPGEFERTLENLREVLPTTFSNVPVAFAMLADALEADDAFCRAFFGRIESMSYASAVLPADLWRRIQRLAVRATGLRVPFTAGYGATETAPMVTSLYWVAEGAGLLGLPAPGVEIKLVPLADGRYEIRARGPNVTPGYYRQPELTAQAFDEEGFYRLGDAARFVDALDPVQGLRFAGRVGEDFKLTTGTWVAVGPLRGAVLEACAPYLRDLVVTGHDRDVVGVLAWPDLTACRRLLGAPDATAAQLCASPRVRAEVSAALARHNAAHTGSSTRIARALLAVEPPSADDGEINDKGYINASAVLARRAALVASLHAPAPGADVLVMPGSASATPR